MNCSTCDLQDGLGMATWLTLLIRKEQVLDSIPNPALSSYFVCIFQHCYSSLHILFCFGVTSQLGRSLLINRLFSDLGDAFGTKRFPSWSGLEKPSTVCETMKGTPWCNYDLAELSLIRVAAWTSTTDPFQGV